MGHYAAKRPGMDGVVLTATRIGALAVARMLVLTMQGVWAAGDTRMG
jgi:hypothetical protein